MNLKEIIRRWFGYSRGERVGSFILVIAVVVVATTRLIRIENNNKQEHSVSSDLPDKIALADSSDLPILSLFDPNSVSKEQLMEFGLSTRQAQTLDNYRRAGGTFSIPDDFRKIYGISAEQQERLIPYIVIDNKFQKRIDIYSNQKKIEEGVDRPEPDQGDSFSELPSLLININNADSIELIRLPGIGRVLGSRIVKYRNLLGGFTSKIQIAEVYGIDTLLVDTISEYIFVDSSDVKKLDLNSVGFRDLLRHPYISKEVTSMIIDYRDYVITVKSFDELLLNRIITLEELNKLKPYLSLSQSDTVILPKKTCN